MKVKINKELLKEGFSPSPDAIKDSVVNKRVITIYYMGDEETSPGWRTILPVYYGAREVKDGKKDYIRAWQNKGKSVRGIPKWKLFRTDRIRNWNVSSNQSFNQPPDPRYNPADDKWMTGGKYAQADFTPGATDKPENIISPPGKKAPTKKAAPKTKNKTQGTPQSSKPTSSTQPEKEDEKKPKKPLKGPARPGASKPPEEEDLKEQLISLLYMIV